MPSPTTSTDQSAAPQRAWDPGAREYTTPRYRPQIEKSIADLKWIAAGEEARVPLPPAMSMQRLVEVNEGLKITATGYGGYLRYPDGPETATYSLVALEVEGSTGPLRGYWMDMAGDLLLVATDQWTRELQPGVVTPQAGPDPEWKSTLFDIRPDGSISL